MHYSEIVSEQFTEHLNTIRDLADRSSGIIVRAALEAANTLASGGTIFFCGNGGSAADSQHFAAELVGRFNVDRKPLRSMALTTDSSVLTCIANDYQYEDIFSRQISGLASPGDTLVAISTSGNSRNIVSALMACKTLELKTIALLGKDGGQAKHLADFSIVVPSNSTARIQEAHALVGHIICDLIERELGYV